MPGTRTDYGQMYDNELNPRKGWSGDRGMALEKVLPVTAGQTSLVLAGCVVHARNDGTSDKWTLGAEWTAEGVKIGYPPAFAFQNERDFDVNPDLGNIAGGGLMALSCLGDFELESTQIASGATFALGNFLTSQDAAGGLTVEGSILPTATGIGSNTVIGIVSETGPNSDGSFENEHGVDVVRFWTWYFPAAVPA